MISFDKYIYPPGPDQVIELDAGEDCLETITSLFLEFGNIYKVYSAKRKAYTYVLSDPEMIRQVMITNNRNYTKGLGIDRVKILLGNGIMSSEGDYWKKQRRMIQPAFHKKVIERLSTEITSANHLMLEEWENKALENTPICLTEELSKVTLRIVLQALFSADLISMEKEGNNPFSLLTEERTRDLSFAVKFRALSALIVAMISQRRKENRVEDDFLSMLMDAHDPETGSGMTDKEIVDEMMTLIVAGHETTASALNWTWYLLARHPEIYDKVKQEVNTLNGLPPDFSHLPQLRYIKQVIDETLRLYPPGWLLTRRSIAEDQIGSYHVPANTDVFISPWLMHRHPQYWDKPEEFNPERFNPDQPKERNRFEYFPFAGGPRQCIGDYFAQVEMQLHIAIVTQKFDLKLLIPEKITLEARINLRASQPFYSFLSLKK